LYEDVLFDYRKLAEILQLEASLFRKINVPDRFFPIYFSVGFYGKGFDPAISNKAFIYRGYELERIADFNQRMLAKFPTAKLLTFTEIPGTDVMNSNDQHLQIFPVKPVSHDELLEDKNERKQQQPANKRKPEFVEKYWAANNVGGFVYSKPYKKTKTNNEFRDLWIHNVYYETEAAFPTIQRRSAIVKVTDGEVSPIENALNTIVDKNKELVIIIGKHEAMKNIANISPFTMVLKGVIDAGVNGGVDMYKKAFFAPDFLQSNPDKREYIGKLKESLNEQMEVLEKGLTFHAKVCPEDMGPMQEQLEVMFAKMKQELKNF